MAVHTIGDADVISDGETLLIELEGREIGVFRHDGEYYAHTNWCPHHGGPMCEGQLSGTTEAHFDPDSLNVDVSWIKEDRVLMCPWHGWEFDVVTGNCEHDDKIQLLSYDVEVKDGKLTIEL